MFIGAHCIIFSKNPSADRIFMREVLNLQHVDAGEGWLIFGLPPAELAVHPYKDNNVHQIYLMCEDIERFIRDMRSRGVTCEDTVDAEWGRLTYISLPGGGKLGVYQPQHARPASFTQT